MELWPERSEVGYGRTLTWVNVEITADVDMESGTVPVALEPLDIVIILDIVLVFLLRADTC